MAETSAVLEQISDNVTYVRGRVDCLDRKVGDLKVQVEHRLTKLEVRAGLIALLVSAIVSITAFLTGCVGSRQLGANPHGGDRVRVVEWAQRVDRIEFWSAHDKVPAAWRHLVDWHSGSWPVIVAVSGNRACAFVLNIDTPDIAIGRDLTCRWRTAR